MLTEYLLKEASSSCPRFMSFTVVNNARLYMYTTQQQCLGSPLHWAPCLYFLGAQWRLVPVSCSSLQCWAACWSPSTSCLNRRVAACPDLLQVSATEEWRVESEFILIHFPTNLTSVLLYWVCMEKCPKTKSRSIFLSIVYTWLCSSATVSRICSCNMFHYPLKLRFSKITTFCITRNNPLGLEQPQHPTDLIGQNVIFYILLYLQRFHLGFHFL